MLFDGLALVLELRVLIGVVGIDVIGCIIFIKEGMAATWCTFICYNHFKYEELSSKQRINGRGGRCP